MGGASSAVVGLISLDDPDGIRPELVGNKAATLAVLRRCGFDVPAGVVVPATVLDDSVEELPADVRAALAALPRALGAEVWAVRSSGTAEDGAVASYAGQFETFLDVDTDGLGAAIVACRRSGLTDRVASYRGEHDAGRLAVLIQPMIPADTAGVAFSANPVSMTAGLATMRALTPAAFQRLDTLGARLRARLGDAFRETGVPGQATGEGSLFRLLFTDRPLVGYRDVDQVAEAGMERLFRAALDAGVLLHTTGLGCLSTPMGEAEVEEIATAVARALETVGRP